jgi:hypothetical protein
VIGWLRQGDAHGFLAQQQREADRQASRWIERGLVGLMCGRQAFGGNQPRVTYTRREKLAVMFHGGA